MAGAAGVVDVVGGEGTAEGGVVSVEIVSRSQMGQREGPGGLPVQV